MSLRLYVDGAAWHAQQQQVLERYQSGLVPVVKGNGYGFGLSRLAVRATALGVDTVAVGTYAEVPTVAAGFGGSVMVLGPYRAAEPVPGGHPAGVIHTVGRLSDLHALIEAEERPRVVLERLTSMRRHGFDAHDLRTATALMTRTDAAEVVGVALHLPMTPGSHLGEMHRLLTDVVAADLPQRRVFVSHLSETELAQLRASYPDYELRPRVGTALWLGRPEALRVRATVLEAHPVERGDAFGYRGRSAPRAGTILVVAGGTSHGIGLSAPTSGATLRARAATLARGGLDAAGFVRSPFLVEGKHRLFAEPPHMQVSMLFLPSGAPVPTVGDEVDVRVRHTITAFDEIVVD